MMTFSNMPQQQTLGQLQPQAVQAQAQMSFMDKYKRWKQMQQLGQGQPQMGALGQQQPAPMQQPMQQPMGQSFNTGTFRPPQPSSVQSPFNK